uniref:Uncharacterized protein n=1 Tax=Oryza punctata TaxID=4537 RepID=A0A0E0LVJ5_ORYPU
MPRSEPSPHSITAPALGKKMATGWTGEKGLPGKLLQPPTTRSATPSASAAIPTSTATIRHHRVDSHRRCIDPLLPHRSTSATSIHATTASIRRGHIDPHLRCLHPLSLRRSVLGRGEGSSSSSRAVEERGERRHHQEGRTDGRGSATREGEWERRKKREGVLFTALPVSPPWRGLGFPCVDGPIGPISACLPASRPK